MVMRLEPIDRANKLIARLNELNSIIESKGEFITGSMLQEAGSIGYDLSQMIIKHGRKEDKDYVETMYDNQGTIGNEQELYERLVKVLSAKEEK